MRKFFLCKVPYFELLLKKPTLVLESALLLKLEKAAARFRSDIAGEPIKVEGWLGDYCFQLYKS